LFSDLDLNRNSFLNKKMNIENDAVAIGYGIAPIPQGNYSIAIGTSAGMLSQADHAIAIGHQAAQYAQGANSIAIGHQAGYINNTPDITTQPARTRSTAVGHQTGIYTKAENNVFVGYKAGWNTKTSNNIFIGAEIEGTEEKGDEIQIGDKQETVRIGVYDLAKILARIEELERLSWVIMPPQRNLMLCIETNPMGVYLKTVA
jgi:hypothetical protein